MLVAPIAGAVLFALITAIGPSHGQTAATGEGDKKPPLPEPKRPGAPGGTWAAKPDTAIEAWSATKIDGDDGRQREGGRGRTRWGRRYQARRETRGGNKARCREKGGRGKEARR